MVIARRLSPNLRVKARKPEGNIVNALNGDRSVACEMRACVKMTECKAGPVALRTVALAVDTSRGMTATLALAAGIMNTSPVGTALLIEKADLNVGSLVTVGIKPETKVPLAGVVRIHRVEVVATECDAEGVLELETMDGGCR